MFDMSFGASDSVLEGCSKMAADGIIYSLALAAGQGQSKMLDPNLLLSYVAERRCSSHSNNQIGTLSLVQGSNHERQISFAVFLR